MNIFRKYDFDGGVHPVDGKGLSSGKPVRNVPLLDKYLVPLHQNIGAPPELVVAKGDSVKKGQRIAAPGGFVSAALHAPTSGSVGDLVTVPGVAGNLLQAVEILADGLDEWGSPLVPIADWANAEPELLKKNVAEAGIIGMGGAAFPAHVKLSPPPQKVIDTLIINGAECEPYLSADHRLMLERTEAIMEGASIAARILNVDRIFFGIERNKPDAIEAAEKIAKNYDIRVVPLRVRYPQGGEKQLIYSITGRAVTMGGLPMDVGCVVQNTGTCAAIRDAVVEGHPLIERFTTLTGSCVADPGTWRVRVGTPIRKLLELAGGVTAEPAKLILGGPMMGFAQASLETIVTKNTSGIVLLKDAETSHYTSNPCIRCGRCVEVCPMHLLPGPLSVAVEHERYDIAEQHYFVMNCMECGSCAYVCPAKRPLVQHFRRAKAEINAIRRRAKK